MLKIRLKELREEKGMSLEELANKVEILPSTISAYEEGEVLPGLSIASMLCEELGVTLDELIVKNKK